jgi:predicted  nucleic acid-binding Zn-ribbon protein
MKFIRVFLKKLDRRGTQERNLAAYSRDFADTKVAIEETKEEADALGADIFELETDTGSIRQRWERNDGQWKRSSSTHRSQQSQSMNKTRTSRSAP